MLPGGPRYGYWWVSSKKDPRFNMTGQCYVGGGIRPSIIDTQISNLEKKLGSKPDDLVWGYNKYYLPEDWNK